MNSSKFDSVCVYYTKIEIPRRPERWLDIPDSAKDVPGVWGNMMTFLGGARSCIGYRFALVE